RLSKWSHVMPELWLGSARQLPARSLENGLTKGSSPTALRRSVTVSMSQSAIARVARSKTLDLIKAQGFVLDGVRVHATVSAPIRAPPAAAIESRSDLAPSSLPWRAMYRSTTLFTAAGCEPVE